MEPGAFGVGQAPRSRAVKAEPARLLLVAVLLAACGSGPRHPTAVVNPRAAGLVKKADIAIERGKLDKAAQLYDAAIYRYRYRFWLPPTVFAKRAAIYREQSNPQGGLDFLERNAEHTWKHWSVREQKAAL